MGKYVARKYTNDFGLNYGLQLIDVHLVTGTRIDLQKGVRQNTSLDFDKEYLTNKWLENVDIFDYQKHKGMICPESNFNMRFVKLYLSDTQYLKVPMIWQPNSNYYNYFMNVFIFNSKIINIGYLGERLEERQLVKAIK